MKKLFYIDACVRGEESRTRRIAKSMLHVLQSSFDITCLDVCELNLLPVTGNVYRDRIKGIHPCGAEKYAQQVKEADLIMIAAPFWDMSFPSVLKVFIEQISISGITFIDTPNGTKGGCMAQKLLYVTTRGMEIADGSPIEQGLPYLRALGQLWGIREVICVSAKGMDMVDDAERESRIRQAEQKGKLLCEDIVNG